jgi:hypothetical protein
MPVQEFSIFNIGFTLPRRLKTSDYYRSGHQCDLDKTFLCFDARPYPWISMWVYQKFTIYTENILEVTSSQETKNFTECGKRCSENQYCMIWTYGTAKDTNNMMDGCYLKVLNHPVPGDESNCPTVLYIPGLMSGTTQAIIDSKTLDIRKCWNENKLIETGNETNSTNGSVPLIPPVVPPVVPVPEETTETTKTTTTKTHQETASTTTTTTTVGAPRLPGGLGGAGGHHKGDNNDAFSGMSEWLHPPKVLWLIFGLLLLLLCCLGAAYAVATSGTHSGATQKHVEVQEEHTHHMAAAPPTQMLAQGPMIPVTMPLPEPAPNLQDTYSKGFIDGMVNWVRENSPNQQYMPQQAGARTVSALPTSTGLQQPSLVSGSQQYGNLASPGVGTTVLPGPGGVGTQMLPGPGGVGTQMMPGPGYMPGVSVSFQQPTPEPGSFVAPYAR